MCIRDRTSIDHKGSLGEIDGDLEGAAGFVDLVVLLEEFLVFLPKFHILAPWGGGAAAVS